MPLDIQLALYQAVDGLLSDFAPFVALMPDGKYRPTLATTTGTATSRRTLVDPAALPKVLFDVGTDSATNTNEAIVMNDDPALVDRAIPVRLNIDFRIVHKADSTLAGQTPLEAAVRAALLSAGRTLGLSWVSRFTIEGVSRGMENLPTSGTAAGTFPTSRFRVVVLGSPMRSLLIAV